MKIKTRSTKIGLNGFLLNFKILLFHFQINKKLSVCLILSFKKYYICYLIIIFVTINIIIVVIPLNCYF